MDTNLLQGTGFMGTTLSKRFMIMIKVIKVEFLFYATSALTAW